MNTALITRAMTYAAIPLCAAIAGSAIATRFPPPKALRSYLQHLAAGVVFSVVAVELLPDITHRHLPWAIAVGFSLGVGAMLGLKHFMGDGEHEEGGEARPRSASTLLLGIGVDVALDGLLIALTFAAGARAGKLLTLALAVEMLSLGLAVTASLQGVGYERKRALATCAAIFMLLPVGTLLGALTTPLLTGAVMEGVLSFGLAALLFLVTEELLVEAHRDGDTPAATALFFAGFLAFLLLGMSSA